MSTKTYNERKPQTAQEEKDKGDTLALLSILAEKHGFKLKVNYDRGQIDFVGPDKGRIELAKDIDTYFGDIVI